MAPPAVPSASDLSIGDDATPEELQRIDDGLDEANRRAAPLHEVRPIACVARDAAGAAVGGAVGRSWGRCAELQQLWVDPARRRQGLGAALVRRFEAVAAGRGCTQVYLETFSFQAPRLYHALGYAPMASIDGFAPGVAKFLMARRLDPPVVENRRGRDVGARNAEGGMVPLMILVAGPYRSGTGDDPVRIQRNVDAMTEASLSLFRAGHLPVMGEWFALPLIAHAGSTAVGDAVFDEIFHPVARRLVEKCDACLRIGGPSAGADEMVALARRHGRAVYFGLDEVPAARPGST